MRDDTSGAGDVYFSAVPEFTPGVSVALSLVFCVVFCKTLFVFFFFGIFNIFLHVNSLIKCGTSHWIDGTIRY